MCSHFLQEYLLYFKEKWCRTAETDPLLGDVDGFRIDLRKKRLLPWQKPLGDPLASD